MILIYKYSTFDVVDNNEMNIIENLIINRKNRDLSHFWKKVYKIKYSERIDEELHKISSKFRSKSSFNVYTYQQDGLIWS